MEIISYGIETELPVVSLENGGSAAAKDFVGDIARLWRVDSHGFSCKKDTAVAGYDNGFNNIEFAIGPIGIEDGLEALHSQSISTLKDIVRVLRQRELGVINLAEHPLFCSTEEEYKRFCIPRPLYHYLNTYRKWQHMAGIDAKAQTSPCTGIAPADALTALNLVMGFSPAFIALFGNSPFESGQFTGYCANRLNLWEQMLRKTVFAGDHKVRRFPERPFDSLYEYFNWMLGEGTVMYAVPLSASSFKEGKPLYIAEKNPSLFNFIQKNRWRMSELYSGDSKIIKPEIFHFEYHQFAQYTDAKIRFGMKKNTGIKELRDALACGVAVFDKFFTDNVAYTYIEGRVPCTNLPDRYLRENADTDAVRSVLISSSALQTGLLRNHKASQALIQSTGWHRIHQLRSTAIKKGISEELTDFTEKALDIALSALNQNEKWMLAYPRYVLETGMNSAQRAIRDFMNGESITFVIKKKIIQ